MKPPLCIECNTTPVRRHENAPTPKRGIRMVDGIAWRWFCSRVCACRHTGATNHSLAGSIANAARARQRLLGRLLTACSAVMDGQQRVSVNTMVETMLRELQRERAAGYSACMQRHRIISPRHPQRISA
jgi:hypothetical protein